MLSIATHRIRLFFRKDKGSYLHFYSILGFYPHDLKYYKQALLHKSSSRKSTDGNLINNERLEFLGDSVLESIVTDILFHRFAQNDEGFLTNVRSKIVKRETLNHIGRQIGLDKLVINDIHTDNHNSCLCGNTFEALIGAIYLDRGYKICRRFIEEKILRQHLDLNQLAHKEENHKSRLLEWAQRNQVSVTFTLLEQHRDEHNNQIFHSVILLQGIACSEGKGYSKKASHQEASQEALQRVKQDGAFRHYILEKAATEPEKESTDLLVGTPPVVLVTTQNEAVLSETDSHLSPLHQEGSLLRH